MNDTQKLSPYQLSEQAGNMTAFATLEPMRQADSQAQRCDILHQALIELIESNGAPVGAVAKAVAAGYATGLICTLELGLGCIMRKSRIEYKSICALAEQHGFLFIEGFNFDEPPAYFLLKGSDYLEKFSSLEDARAFLEKMGGAHE